jgi:single-strand DNA-binding protein
VTFGLATNRTWRDPNGQKQSLAEYHNLVAWGKLAEFIDQNVKKGKPLFIEGYLKTRSWDGETGSKVYRTEIVVDNIILVGPRPDGERDDFDFSDSAAPESSEPNDLPPETADAMS